MRDVSRAIPIIRISTLVGSEHKLLTGVRFGTLFIDEAAQALEATAWIPARIADRIILAGDHCQLPPTVKSYEALRAGLGKSLMERIVDNHPEAVTLLTMQYRMNEQIMQFPNEWFYHGRIKGAPEVRFRGILDLDTPIEWVDTADAAAAADSEAGDDNNSEARSAESGNSGAYREALAGQSYGRVNRDEAILTLLTLGEYFIRIGKRRILEERIDGFQGQERDLIVVSLVRSNDEGQIGFLRDLRRMNVAITRARMKLIIIGHSPTLTRYPFYRRLYDYIRSLRKDPE